MKLKRWMSVLVAVVLTLPCIPMTVGYTVQAAGNGKSAGSTDGMILVQGGTFTMGSPERGRYGGNSDEKTIFR